MPAAKTSSVLTESGSVPASPCRVITASGVLPGHLVANGRLLLRDAGGLEEAIDVADPVARQDPLRRYPAELLREEGEEIALEPHSVGEKSACPPSDGWTTYRDPSQRR